MLFPMALFFCGRWFLMTGRTIIMGWFFVLTGFGDRSLVIGSVRDDGWNVGDVCSENLGAFSGVAGCGIGWDIARNGFWSNRGLLIQKAVLISIGFVFSQGPGVSVGRHLSLGAMLKKMYQFMQQD